MTKRRTQKVVKFYQHQEVSTSRRYHASSGRTIPQNISFVANSAPPVPEPPSVHDAGLDSTLADDLAPEVIEHQIPGYTVVAKLKGDDPRKRYECTVSNLLSVQRLVAYLVKQIAPLLGFKRHRQEYLDEEIRLEGRRGLSALPCPGCNHRSPQFRCEDCSGGEILCQACMVKRHEILPLHVVKVGRFELRSYNALETEPTFSNGMEDSSTIPIYAFSGWSSSSTTTLVKHVSPYSIVPWLLSTPMGSIRSKLVYVDVRMLPNSVSSSSDKAGGLQL